MQGKPTGKKQKLAISKRTMCITEDEVLESIRRREVEKEEAEQVKKMKQSETDYKRKEFEMERGEKKGEKEQKIQRPEPQGELFAEMQVSNDESTCTFQESDATCPKHGLMYFTNSSIWICGDGCNVWFNLTCTDVNNIVVRAACKNLAMYFAV